MIKEQRKKRLDTHLKKKTEDFQEQIKKNDDIMNRIKVAEEMREALR